MNRVNKLVFIFSLSVLVACEPKPASESEQVVPVQSVALPELSPEQQELNRQTIAELIAQERIPVDDIRSFGLRAIPVLTQLYKEADNNKVKSRIAHVFWKLGWKSPEIEKALIADLDSDDASLKVQVQWGIAKSSDSTKVLKKVLYNLENDPSAFVRDKAACALASDFKHISSAQRMILLRGLVSGLDNDIQQVRASSILALQIQTGQNKNFVANGDVKSRASSIQAWNRWLDEYERNL